MLTVIRVFREKKLNNDKRNTLFLVAFSPSFCVVSRPSKQITTRRRAFMVKKAADAIIVCCSKKEKKIQLGGDLPISK
jgi:hypothetical protein